MENLGGRALVSQLADDLAWLEDHCRRRPEQAAQAVELRLAAALVRNCIGPFIDNQPAEPLHVAVVGGAGAGKSTVANFLSGAPAAEANPQAGFTRHPVAYVGNGATSWTSHLGFLGPLQKLEQPSPANMDADVYQVRHVSANGDAGELLHHFVVWDCPDMTTWAATGYVPRLLEVAGLADVIVYVASDERYNDEVPTEFLRLLLQAGKLVVVCLMKMKESDAPALIAHFQKEVLSKMPGGAVACLAIPHLTAAQLADPVHQAGRYRISLLNQVSVLGEPPAAARRRAVRWATHYLNSAQARLLGVARQDLAALQSWRGIVQAGKVEFEERYRREYLSSERFHRFDESLVRLMELLELPNVGRFVSNTLWVLRTPYRLLKGALTKAFARHPAPAMPELPVLQTALAGWLDGLRKEAARRANTHAVWAHIADGFDHGLADQAQGRFEQAFRGFQLGLADEIDRTARAIYEELEKSPAKLKVLRGGKLAIDMAAVAGAVVSGGHSWGLDFVLVPLYASITHQLVELLGKGYVDTQREQTRVRQFALVQQQIADPLAEWLGQWPATGGSTYERLQQALRRIPVAVQQLGAVVTAKLSEAPATAREKLSQPS